MPKWRQFDAEATRILSMTGGRGRVVLFATTPDFISRPEAMTLAIAVARGWAASGAEVVLADGCFEDPRLDAAVHLPNDEGLVDVLFVGVSLQDVTQPGGRDRFHILTTGVSAPGSVPRVGHERWTRLTAEIHREGLTFALLAPLDSDLGRRALTACTDIVVLARSGDDVESLLPSDEERVREVIGPVLQRAQPLADQPTPPPADAPPTPSPAGRSRRTATEPQTAEVFELFAAEHLATPVEPAAEHLETPVEPVEEGEPPSAPKAEPEAPLRVLEPRPAAPSPWPDRDDATRTRPQWRGTETKKDLWQEAAEAARHQGSHGTRGKVMEPERRVPLKPGVVAPYDLPLPAATPRGGRRWARLLGLGVVAAGLAVFVQWDAGQAPASQGIQPPSAAPVAVEGAPLPEMDPEETALAAPVLEEDITLPDEPPAEQPSAPVVPVNETAPHQRFSLSVAAFGEPGPAAALLRSLAQRAPDHAFLIAPIDAGERVFYRVLAGLAVDRSGALAVRDVIALATGEDSGDWLLREAPFAFALGDFPALEGASERVADLQSAGVHAYVLTIDHDDGSVLHRVYAGAYAGRSEASRLEASLRTAGVEPVLVERRGRFIR